jgi:hypothetical protein
MTIKTKMLVAAATLTVASGLAAVGTAAAAAATPQCGTGCIQIFSAKFGTNDSPRFVETVLHGVATAGQPTIVAPPSSSNPAGDLIATHPASGGLVSDFFAAGLVSAAVNQHYGSEMAVQIEYAPLGQDTGLCSALATTAYQNEGLTLQPCSTPGTTVWIVDTADAPAAAPYFPIVNGSTTDFTHPFAMIIHGNPAHKRFPQIKVQRLRGNPDHVRISQLWGANVSH